MNGSSEMIDGYVRELKVRVSAWSEEVETILAPPSLYLPQLKRAVEGLPIGLAAQNVAATVAGAFTGEVSAEMLADAGCKWCLIGHSERRALFAETDAQIVEKAKRLLEVGINPILCVGETLAQREQGEAQSVVAGQLEEVLKVFDEAQLAKLVVAYEPVWAIGTGKTASPEQAQEMHAFIRSCVAKTSAALAAELSILYGGSVNAENAATLFAQQDIDGGLIGGASLKADAFARVRESMG